MPVIINEFEVVADAPELRGGAQETTPSARPGPTSVGMLPEDLRRMLGFLEQRLARVTAD